MNTKKLFIISIIPVLAVFSKCSADGSSSSATGFDISSSSLPENIVDNLPTWSFSIAGPMTGSKKFASILYAYSATQPKLGISIAEYSATGKLKYKILLNFTDAWTTALPTTANDTGSVHTLSNGTATLMVTETEGQAPRFYSISIPTVTSVKIAFATADDKISTSLKTFHMYTVTFPVAVSLPFTSAGYTGNISMSDTIFASGTSE